MATIRHQNRIKPSAFVSTANGIATLYAGKAHETDFEIRKIEAIVNTNNVCVNSVTGLHRQEYAEDFPAWFGSYEEGLYTVNGYRFDVRLMVENDEQSKTIVWQVDSEELESGQLSPVSLIFDSSQPQDPLSDDFMDFYSNEDSECSRCGGGGCPSCDTTGFFTGIRVSNF